MARLITTGYEIGLVASGNLGQGDGRTGGSGTAPVLQGSVVRSGAQAVECVAGSGSFSFFWRDFPGVTGRTYYARFYIRFPDVTPAANYAICRYSTSGGSATYLHVRLTTSSTLILYDTVNSVQVGSDSSPISINTWYRVEVSININSSAGSNDSAALRLDGVEVASSTTLALATAAAVQFGMGLSGATSGESFTCYVDDLAINDDQESSQNSWPGEGKIVLLRPTADSQVGTWTGGAGGTSNLYQAVDNTPPVGIATETDSSQIESSDTSGDNATDEYRAALTTCSTAGLVAGDTIQVMQAIVDHAEDTSSGTKTGRLYFQANPAGSVTTETFTFGDNQNAAGTWPSLWATHYGREAGGSVMYAPSVDFDSAPILALRRVSSNSVAVQADFLGAYVDYVPAVPGQPLVKRWGGVPFLGHGQASTARRVW